jgi:uncharacterized membrane protein
MSDHQVTMLAAVYPSPAHARTTLDMLENMHKALTITLKDAAMITRDEHGKIKVHETKEVTTRKGLRRGVIVGGVLGIIYPPSLLLTGALGGAIGGLMGRIRDTGIKNPELKKLADQLTIGQAAIVALVTNDTLAAAQNAITGYEGVLLTQPVSDEMMKRIAEAEASEQTATGDRPDFH